LSAEVKGSEDVLDSAQYSSFYNRKSIEASVKAGCFYCLNSYYVDEVVDWLDEQYEQQASAVCPRCKAGAVIGDASGFPIEEDFLRKMKKRWYKGLLANE
jgi:hypothetical protein